MMPVLRFGGIPYEVLESESVLDCLLRHGLSIGHSCKQGICQGCLLKVTQGEVGVEAQHGLKAAWRAQGYVLSCRMRAAPGMTFERIHEAPMVRARIAGVEWINTTVVRVLLRLVDPFTSEPGQFVHLLRADGLSRPYSIASLGGREMELHVAVRAHQGMSQWLANEAPIGTEITIRGPFGECFYLPGRPHERLVLAATGTGLAPLLAVLRSALRAEHAGPIWLYHGSRTAAGLYLWEELQALSARHANVTITGCVERNERQFAHVRTERLEERVLADHPSLAGARVFLCGNPEMVRALRRVSYLAGASLDSIHSDPFVAARRLPEP